MNRRLSISPSWLRRWRKTRQTERPVLPLLPVEIWLRIISYLPLPDEWAKTRLYRVNRLFLDHYIQKRYQDIVLFNPVPYLKGFAKTQYQDEHLTQRNLSILRDPRRSEVVKTVKIRFKVQYFDYHRGAAEPEDLEVALRSYLELLREGQEIQLPSLSDSPRIYLPRLNKFTLDLSKAHGFGVDPQKLDTSLREHIHPFLTTHAHLITTFSISTPQDDPQIGDACFSHLPTFPLLETLSIQISSDRSSTWDGALRFLQRHSTKLKHLKIILLPRLISERHSRDTTASISASHNWIKQVFWSIPMPALIEFQLFTDISPVERGPSLDLLLPKSTNSLERIILSKPISTPGDLGRLIHHLQSSDGAPQLKELFIPKAELDLAGLKILAKGLPRLRRLSVHSIDPKISGAEPSGLNEETLGAAQYFSEWGLEQLDFRHFPLSSGDSVRYRNAIALVFSNVRVFQGVDRLLWVDNIQVV